MKAVPALLLSLALFAPSLVLAQSQAGASTPAQPSQSTATATSANTADNVFHLHVYRQHRYEGYALAPSIFVDDKQIARVGNGRRVTIRLTPGSHTIRSDDKSSAITLDGKSGQDYYVRIDEAAGFWKGHGKLTLVLPEQGAPEFKLEKPVEADRRFDKELIEPDDDTSVAKSN